MEFAQMHHAKAFAGILRVSTATMAIVASICIRLAWTRLFDRVRSQPFIAMLERRTLALKGYPTSSNDH